MLWIASATIPSSSSSSSSPSSSSSDNTTTKQGDTSTEDDDDPEQEDQDEQTMTGSEALDSLTAGNSSDPLTYMRPQTTQPQ
jgi:hypothetical protein